MSKSAKKAVIHTRAERKKTNEMLARDIFDAFPDEDYEMSSNVLKNITTKGDPTQEAKGVPTRMTSIFKQSGHPVFRGKTAFFRGTFNKQSRKNVDTS